MTFPTEWKNIKFMVPNHQPGYYLESLLGILMIFTLQQQGLDLWPTIELDRVALHGFNRGQDHLIILVSFRAIMSSSVYVFSTIATIAH